MSREYPSDWNSRRKAVYQRDNFTCQNCGRRGGPHGNYELHAHHIVPKSKGGTHRKSNLKTLCKQCHNAIHGNRSAPTGGNYAGSSGNNKKEINLRKEPDLEIIGDIMVNYPVVGASLAVFVFSTFLYVLSAIFVGYSTLFFIFCVIFTAVGYTTILHKQGVRSKKDLRQFYKNNFE